MIELFRIERIGRTNAKFDRAKLLAFNTDAIAAASPDRLLAAFKDYLALNDTPIPAGDEGLLRRLLVSQRGLPHVRRHPRQVQRAVCGRSGVRVRRRRGEKVLQKNAGQGLAVLTELRERSGPLPLDGGGLGGLDQGLLRKERPGHGQGRPADPRGRHRQDDQPADL